MGPGAHLLRNFPSQWANWVSQREFCTYSKSTRNREWRELTRSVFTHCLLAFIRVIRGSGHFQRICRVGIGCGRIFGRRQRSRLREIPLLRSLPLPRHHQSPSRAHPRSGRRAGRAPQASPSPGSGYHRPVQPAGAPAQRRTLDGKRTGDRRPRPGEPPAGAPPEVGRRRSRSLRLGRRPARTRHPGAPGGPEPAPRRRRSEGQCPLAATGLSGAKKPQRNERNLPWPQRGTKDAKKSF